MQSTLLTLLAAIAQLCALLWYLVSYFPMGSRGTSPSRSAPYLHRLILARFIIRSPDGRLPGCKLDAGLSHLAPIDPFCAVILRLFRGGSTGIVPPAVAHISFVTREEKWSLVFVPCGAMRCHVVPPAMTVLRRAVVVMWRYICIPLREVDAQQHPAPASSDILRYRNP